MNYFQKRRIRKNAADMLRHAKHAWDMKEDIADPHEMARLAGAVDDVRASLRSRSVDDLPGKIDRLDDTVSRIMPAPRFHLLREYVEIAAVAIAVAMGFRAYFIQPFKIPTGSMQPSLYGIHYQPCEKPGITDRLPLKPFKWFITGAWYTETKAVASGNVTIRGQSQFYSPLVDEDNRIIDSRVEAVIGNKPHHLPVGSYLHVKTGDYVIDGHVLASGLKMAGDHVFVNKVIWNFTQPKRGDVMVFLTSGIKGLDQDKHYIKRTVGLPNEEITIVPPKIYIADGPVTNGMIGVISSRAPGYAGYKTVHFEPHLSYTTGPGEYFMLGDNTGSSRDSRYWGSAPQKNIVGPAAIVYWPFRDRFGLITR